ncbi:MAG: stage III sporulation protein D [Clostridia bacterium]|nr:stage III sporulation protein D [Clostridia bacterium]
MRSRLGERCQDVGRYIAENQCTIRQVAEAKGISKSTVHKDVTERLEFWNYHLYIQVRKVIDKNKAERHLRGGEDTRRKHLK